MRKAAARDLRYQFREVENILREGMVTEIQAISKRRRDEIRNYYFEVARFFLLLSNLNLSARPPRITLRRFWSLPFKSMSRP
jgi:hypothetical protein